MLRLRLASAARLTLQRVHTRCLSTPAPGSKEAVAAKFAAAAPKGEFTGASRPVQLGLWALVSLNVGAWFSQGDEGAQILIHLEEFTGALLDRETTRTRLTERLERVARGSQLNDSLKLKLLREPGLPERLLELLATDADNVSAAARMHAAKTLENISSLREAKLEMVERGLHAPIVAVVADDGATLHARKTLAAAVCNLAAAPENVAALGAAGAVAALDGEQRFSAKLSRQKVRVALQRLGAALDADHAAVVNAMPPAERELVARLAAEAAEAADDPLNAARATLIESGVLLYLHTAAGGAAWGLFESVRNGEPRPVLMQNVARTSLVTCFVPILLVGGVVTAYERLNRTTDSINEKFALYGAACLALYPAGRLLQWVETFAPLWLGGHIVGFSSFFGWTLYTESDLLKSDRELLSKAEQREQRAKR